MNQHGGIHGGDRRGWLIISKREAEAILPILRDYIEGAPQLEDQDLLRAERVITQQLQYIEGGTGYAGDPTQALIRDLRS